MTTSNVYERFIEEFDALTITADQPAVAVVGELTRAVKRARSSGRRWWSMASLRRLRIGSGGSSDG